MLLWLAHLFQPDMHSLRVFHYLTFRTIIAALTALLISLSCSPKFIRRLISQQIGQTVRTDGPQSHLKKSGTPTMGGALILIAVAISIFLWGDLNNRYVWIVTLVMLSYGVIGWVDDFRKVTLKSSDGLTAKRKFFWQSLVALMAACVLYATADSPANLQLVIPFVKSALPSLGWFYIVLTYFVIVGSSNAVNLTDGLDGLALMPTVLIAVALGIFAYVAGNRFFS